MYTVSDVYRGNFGNLNYVRYLRIQHEETGEERLIEPFELKRAERLQPGDNVDYEVRLTSLNQK